MRQIREVLRLAQAKNLSPTQIAIAAHLPRTTVRNYLSRAAAAGLSWPLPGDLDDRGLEERLFGRPAPPPAILARPVPDWEIVHAELRRPGVTQALLWTEYRERHSGGFGYTWFTESYHAYVGKLDLVMRQDHHAGEKLFLDFAGHTIPIVDPDTGEIRRAQIFLAVLGASSYTYAEALPSQELTHWCAANVRAFEFFGGVPAILVPDNLKSAVAEAHRYEPDLNRSYSDLAAHYGTAIIPARSRKPRDKAKVEVGVQVAERWILAALRNRTFFSIAEANAAIAERLTWLNNRPFRKLDGTRRSVFEAIDRPALRSLPSRPYEFATWKRAKVSIDYHLEVDHHYYSVPYQLVGQRADVRISAAVIEVFVDGRRVASHPRSSQHGRHTTTDAHMPASHRAHRAWTPDRLLTRGGEVGPSTGALLSAILASRIHPEQGFRPCLGVLRLGDRFGHERLEAACARALAAGAIGYRSVDSILKAGLDRTPLPAAAPARPRVDHANVRGATYYR
jgi:transposase